ncbi:MAG: hypothetical protein Q4C93_03295, partial [Clostridia bacterium]|nr:hypothetical protein [Clostridia bacterium]
YSALPAEIPMHYTADGSVRDYESKSTVWLILGVEVLIYAVLTVVMFVPKLSGEPDLPWEVKDTGKLAVQRETLSLLSECKLLSLVIYVCISVITVEGIVTKMPIVLVLCPLLLIPLFIRLARISRYKK